MHQRQFQKSDKQAIPASVTCGNRRSSACPVVGVRHDALRDQVLLLPAQPMFMMRAGDTIKYSEQLLRKLQEQPLSKHFRCP
jgi:hypothetical protein